MGRAWKQLQETRPWLGSDSARLDLSRYRADPVGYAHDILGVTLTPDQSDICRSVVQHRYTSVKASHACGKTFSAAVLANWWFSCWPSHICYITAPTWPQAIGLTFKTAKKLRADARLTDAEVLESGLIRDRDPYRALSHYIKALNAERSEGFQGEHSADILIIMEEAVGVPPYIWAGASGLMTGAGCRLLAIGNPTDEATLFGESCRSTLFRTLTISALTHPNVEAELRCEPAPFPGAVRLLWLVEMLQQHCEVVDNPGGDTVEFYALPTLLAALSGVPVPRHAPRVSYQPNALFQGRVLGQFPTQASENVIPRAWLESLVPLDSSGHLPEIGCDVARFGEDRTVIATRQGPCLLRVATVRHMDNLQVAEALRQATAEAMRHAGCAREKVRIRIDVTGGLGSGPYDLLRSEGYSVVGVNASQQAVMKEQFPNRRSEMWWAMRERVRSRELDLSRMAEAERTVLIRELSAPKYGVDARGRKLVEEKEKIKKALGVSPDAADAVNLAFVGYGRWWEDEALREWFVAREARPLPARVAHPASAVMQLEGS